MEQVRLIKGKGCVLRELTRTSWRYLVDPKPRELPVEVQQCRSGAAGVVSVPNRSYGKLPEIVEEHTRKRLYFVANSPFCSTTSWTGIVLGYSFKLGVSVQNPSCLLLLSA